MSVYALLNLAVTLATILICAAPFAPIVWQAQVITSPFIVEHCPATCLWLAFMVPIDLAAYGFALLEIDAALVEFAPEMGIYSITYWLGLTTSWVTAVLRTVIRIAAVWCIVGVGVVMTAPTCNRMTSYVPAVSVALHIIFSILFRDFV